MDHPRVGVCLDTCHLLTAGYDICYEEGYEETFRHLVAIVGLDRCGLPLERLEETVRQPCRPA